MQLINPINSVLFMHKEMFLMELYHLDIAFPVPLVCTVVPLGSFLLVHNCKPKPIDKNIAHWKKIL